MKEGRKKMEKKRCDGMFSPKLEYNTHASVGFSVSGAPQHVTDHDTSEESTLSQMMAPTLPTP